MPTGVEKFAKDVRKTLWPLSKDHREYHAWDVRVDALKQEKGYTLQQAQVQAAKEQPACLRLFGRHDVSMFDPEPGSHEDVEVFMSRKREENAQKAEKVVCEQTEQTYRENLAWALQAAGKFNRTAEEPESCPNDSAFYLYRRAIEEPKEFMARVNQLELKAKGESGDAKAVRHSIKEIDMMLEAFCEGETEENE